MSELTQTNPTRQLEEDEIDLRELWQTIKANKKFIATFTFIVTLLTLVYTLQLPNTYQASAVLMPAQQNNSALSSLSGLAAMAGVSVGSSASMTPDQAFEVLLDNDAFMRQFIEDHKLAEYYYDVNKDKNYYFALGFSELYMFLHHHKQLRHYDHDAQVYMLTQILQKQFSISADKQSGLITVAFNDFDKAFATKMVNDFLNDASKYLTDNDLKNTDISLSYYKKEFADTDAVEIRQNLATLISQVVQQKIMTKSKKYYQCDMLTPPIEPYFRDKSKPKRALILVVSMVTGIILSIFIVFFREFLRKEENVHTSPWPKV